MSDLEDPGYASSLRQQARWVREAVADPASHQAIALDDIDTDELDAAADEIERLRKLVQDLLNNDPNEYISDAGHTVLDLWRQEARKALGQMGDNDDDVVCVNARDLCYGGAGKPCPYCERKQS